MESTNVVLTRNEFFEVCCTVPKSERLDRLVLHICNKSNICVEDFDQIDIFKTNVSKYLHTFNEKFYKVGCRKDRFLTTCQSWLQLADITINLEENNDEILEEQPTCSKRAGRPIKSFESCAERTKRRKVQELLELHTSEELTYAAQKSQRADGNRLKADTMKAVSEFPEDSKRIKQCLQKQEKQRMFTPEEALASYVDNKMTRRIYNNLRKDALKIGHFLYPSTHMLQKAKKECFPDETAILVNEISAGVKVQDIVDITIVRLLKSQSSFIANHVADGMTLTLVCKWGGDGSSGYSRYKQQFQDESSTDEYLFILSFVPIKLYIENVSKQIIWENRSPSSTQLCRPFKLILAKESEDLSVKEFNDIENQISALQPVTTSVASKNVTVKTNFVLTMIDGKIANFLTSTRSTQSCYICGARPSEMNNVALLKTPTVEFYRYGLSTLHAWIKAFECLLHIAYRLDVRKWAIREPADKLVIEKKKKIIQSRFRKEVGILIEVCKPGYGTTHDGNTARTFFKNPEKSANITGINVALIKNFNIILSCISSGIEINLPVFQTFLEETRKLYISLYGWYCMPVSVHKILCHGSEIIKQCVVPIGQLSEEAQEARNKDCRRFRMCNTRKSSRVNTNRDLLNMLLISSDPVINSYRKNPLRKHKSFTPEMQKFLMQQEEILEGNSSSSDTSSDYDSESSDS